MNKKIACVPMLQATVQLTRCEISLR